MPDNNVFYHSSPYHSNNYILSLAFNFDKEEDVYQFAFCYPYSYSKCQAHLDHLERRGMPFFKRELLGQSLDFNNEIIVMSVHDNCPLFIRMEMHIFWLANIDFPSTPSWLLPPPVV
ncbi:unnamed protein product [Nezara viridula]|uniref:Uncharacterized protein n=1 Tax=Nezara viridula TaxID=85310 RepID=A0A9P0H4B3_NEZVI|nr:unnamed protein product [Nezara viridula]